ncbi:DUF86 domain-containing protein [Candidatus Kaiserbacteria bacterium]|nr:DUF86 domain-containing protein [Candidatus Kaiserbacteria bacterium]
MKKDSNVFAREMLQLIENARLFVGTMTRAEFVEDHKTAASVLLEIIMLGEMAKRAPEDMKEKVDIPWRDIAGFRDRAIHQYSKIDMDIVAGIIFDRLDSVESALRTFIAR